MYGGRAELCRPHFPSSGVSWPLAGFGQEEFWQDCRGGGRKKPRNFSLSDLVSISFIIPVPFGQTCLFQLLQLISAFGFSYLCFLPLFLQSRSGGSVPLVLISGLFPCPLGFSLNLKYLEHLLEEQLEMMVFYTLGVYFMISKLYLPGLLDSLSAESTHPRRG